MSTRYHRGSGTPFTFNRVQDLACALKLQALHEAEARAKELREWMGRDEENEAEPTP